MANIYLSIDCHGLIRSINIQNAIEMYYKIPKKARINFITEDEIEKLLIEKKTSNKECISEMNTFKIRYNQTHIDVNYIHKEISDRIYKSIYPIVDFTHIRYNFDQLDIILTKIR